MEIANSSCSSGVGGFDNPTPIPRVFNTKGLSQDYMKTKQEYINDAIADFKQLVIYFNVTRPQHEKNYYREGRFDLNKMLEQIKFLNDWKKKTRTEKKYGAGRYSLYSTTYNLTFGIPRELISSTLGSYRDEDGKKHRISIDEVIEPLVKQNYIKVVNAGKKFKKDDEGNYKVKCWWNKKYLLANEKYWFKLLNDKKYSNIEGYASKRVRDILFKWVKSYRNDPHEQQEEAKTTTNENTTMKMNDADKKELTKKVILLCLERGILSPAIGVQWMGDLVYFRKTNPFTIDEATMIYNTKPQAEKNILIDKILTCMKSHGIEESEAIYILVNGLK